MDAALRRTLKAVVLELRHLLEGRYDDHGRWQPGDLEQRLASMGVRRDRPVVDAGELSHLSPADRNAREVVDAYLRFRADGGASVPEAVAEFVRETAYTWANRLLVLRCMEARELIDDVILQKDVYGHRSLEHHRLAQRNPELCAGEDDGLFAVLDRAFARHAGRLPQLFNPRSPAVALRPSAAVLKECIALLSLQPDALGRHRVRLPDAVNSMEATAIPTAVFAAPDALGWAYQYWNTKEKERVFEKVRTQKGAKIEGADIVPATQLYTEDYMVKFLVQNSLGATWMGMHPESKLYEKWEYYVRQADRAPVTAKPVEEISFLDPAMGSGHFHLEAFDIFYDMYVEEGRLTDPVAICHSILTRNLYGTDIDERAVQIAEAALWMKAADKCRQHGADVANDDAAGLFPAHFVAANVQLPRGKDHLNAYLATHPEDRDLRPALEAIFEGLSHVDEIGSLVQIEEPVEKELRTIQRRSAAQVGKGVQPDMFRQTAVQGELPVGTVSYDAWKQRMLGAVREHFAADAHTTDFTRAFFGSSGQRALALFDLLSRRYDVVAANPPYMGSKNMAPGLKAYIQARYDAGRRDLYSAFIQKSLTLLVPQGRCGMVTLASWMALNAFSELRAAVLARYHLDAAVQLGRHAFSEADPPGFPVLFVISDQGEENADTVPAGRMLLGIQMPMSMEAERQSRLLKEKIRLNAFGRIKEALLQHIPGSPIILSLPEKLVRLLASGVKLGDVADVPKGLTTADNARFLRCYWETASEKRWVPYAKGGAYRKWTGLIWNVVDYELDGARLRSFGKAVLRNQRFYRRSGLTYTEVARGAFGVRVLPDGCLFDARSPGIFPRDDNGVGLLAALNSRVSCVLFRQLSPGILLDQAYAPMVPVCRLEGRDEIRGCTDLATTLRNSLAACELTERTFSPGSLCRTHIEDACAAALLHTIEAYADEAVCDEMGLDAHERSFIYEKAGEPAGFSRLISGLDMLPEHPACRNIPAAVTKWFQKAERTTLSSDERTSLVNRLQDLFEQGEVVAEPADESSAEGGDGDDEGDTEVAASIPVPAETLVERISQELNVHPVSVYWLMREIRKATHRTGLDVQRRRRWSDHVTVTVLGSLGFRWPRQIEAGEGVPDWADPDGIIPITDTLKEPPLIGRVRVRLSVAGPSKPADSEREFSEVMGVSVESWLADGYFAHHTRQFKKRPITWQVTSASCKPAFACLLYYHKCDDDLLPKLRTQYVGPLRQRYETELTGLARIGDAARTDRQDARRVELEGLIRELQTFDDTLVDVIRSGFGPEPLLPTLRQAAIVDAVHHQKARWLMQMESDLSPEMVPGWASDAAALSLHHDLPRWVQEAFTHLGHFCTAVGEPVPDEKRTTPDPTAASLSDWLVPQADRMLIQALGLACARWWKRYDEAVLLPLRQEITAARKRATEIRAILKGDEAVENAADLELERRRLQHQVKLLQKELDEKTDPAKELRESIEAWRSPDAATWARDLATGPLYDMISSVDGLRPPPATVEDFVRQEGQYVPDINDGVRVNIAPIQKAGLLAAPVLAAKDLDKAIADRAEWRADERRWVREGKLPQPGWWKRGAA